MMRSMRRTLQMVVSVMTLIAVVHIVGVTEPYAMSGPPRTIRLEPLSEVLIGRGRIAFPLKRIVLVRAGSSYCAVRFTKAYGGKTDAEDFAEYESWYQGDGTGNFSSSNVVYAKRDLWWKAPIGIGRLWLMTRDRDEVQCGPITLSWMPDTVIELTPKKAERVSGPLRFAPTPWTSISEVNVHDARIKWYEPGMHGENTPDIRIPIDQLWK